MPNSSNKNFPHAYGAGRVIAAFRLAHSGGSPVPVPAEGLQEFSFGPAALDPGGDVLVAANPYPWPDGFPWLPADSGGTFLPAPYAVGNWVPYRMPYNVTNYGVYAVGSGTAPFLYKDMLQQQTNMMQMSQGMIPWGTLPLSSVVTLTPYCYWTH